MASVHLSSCLSNCQEENVVGNVVNLISLSVWFLAKWNHSLLLKHGLWTLYTHSIIENPWCEIFSNAFQRTKHHSDSLSCCVASPIYSTAFFIFSFFSAMLSYDLNSGNFDMQESYAILSWRLIIRYIIKLYSLE